MPEEPKYPQVVLGLDYVMGDGNVFGIIGRVRQALKTAGEKEGAGEFVEKAWGECDSYEEVLALVKGTVTLT